MDPFDMDPFAEQEMLSDPEPWTDPEHEPEDHYFQARDGVKLHYVEWPANEGATPLIMLHGRLAHSRWFDPVAMDLSPQYRCISFDLRGHGESESDGETTLNIYAGDVAELLERFAGQRCILMLHSFAGRVGLVAYQRFGIKPDLLILADAPLYRRPPSNRMRKDNSKPRRYPTREMAIDRFRLMPPGSSANPDLMYYLAEHSVRQHEDGSWGWKYTEDTLKREFGSDFPDGDDLEMEKIECPTLVIYGEHSMLMDSEEAAMIAQRLGQGTIKEVPDTFHHLMLDRPHAYNQAILQFFESHGF